MQALKHVGLVFQRHLMRQIAAAQDRAETKETPLAEGDPGPVGMAGGPLPQPTVRVRKSKAADCEEAHTYSSCNTAAFGTMSRGSILLLQDGTVMQLQKILCLTARKGHSQQTADCVTLFGRAMEVVPHAPPTHSSMRQSEWDALGINELLFVQLKVTQSSVTCDMGMWHTGSSRVIMGAFFRTVEVQAKLPTMHCGDMHVVLPATRLVARSEALLRHAIATTEHVNSETRRTAALEWVAVLEAFAAWAANPERIRMNPLFGLVKEPKVIPRVSDLQRLLQHHVKLASFAELQLQSLSAPQRTTQTAADIVALKAVKKQLQRLKAEVRLGVLTHVSRITPWGGRSAGESSGR